jgi:hypothetical protein
VNRCNACGESCGEHRCSDCQQHYVELGELWAQDQYYTRWADVGWYSFAAVCWVAFLVYCFWFEAGVTL